MSSLKSCNVKGVFFSSAVLAPSGSVSDMTDGLLLQPDASAVIFHYKAAPPRQTLLLLHGSLKTYGAFSWLSAPLGKKGKK